MEVKKKKGQSQYPLMIIPAIIFVIFVVSVISVYKTKFNEANRQSTLEQLELETAQYEMQMEQQLRDLEEAARPVIALLEQGTVRKKERALQTLKGNTRASSVALLDLDGKGLDTEGNDVTLDLADCLQNIEAGENSYSYDVQKNQIVLLMPVVKAEQVYQVLMICYDMSEFDRVMAGFDFGKDAWIALIDDEGEVLYYFSEKPMHYLVEKTNFYELYAEAEGESADTIKQMIYKTYAGSQKMDLGKDERQIFYQPMEINHWYVITGVPSSYVDAQLKITGKPVSTMVILIVIATILFALAIVTINTKDRFSSKIKSEGLTRLAETDQLTGLYNKVTTEKKIKEYLAENPNSQSLMFVLDIDNFKKINDTMGHAFGDEVLRTIGQTIRMEFRASDIIGRAGGDEFIILLKGLKDDEIIIKEAQKVERFFKEFKAGTYVKYSATASIGCAVFPRDATDFEGLYKAADQALYRAKQRGKNQLAFYKDIEGFGQSV
jgi:diguanylate cyclase (GGDEF)-like protein